MRRFVAYIDPNNEFCEEDKLSQVGLCQRHARKNNGNYFFLHFMLSIFFSGELLAAATEHCQLQFHARRLVKKPGVPPRPVV